MIKDWGQLTVGGKSHQDYGITGQFKLSRLLTPPTFLNISVIVKLQPKPKAKRLGVDFVLQ